MPTDPSKASQQPAEWPFPESAPDKTDGDAFTPRAADADLLGDSVPFMPPTLDTEAPAAGAAKAGNEGATPGPAEDENRPGFVGDRNLPHAP